jgi:hypothetical protein
MSCMRATLHHELDARTTNRSTAGDLRHEYDDAVQAEQKICLFVVCSANVVRQNRDIRQIISSLIHNATSPGQSFFLMMLMLLENVLVSDSKRRDPSDLSYFQLQATFG